ncbi:ABC transporter ATP-binding protein [Actinosynnema sp. NPDC047251]|uniref:ABC transporter-like protein n=1 Tax=Saccharothrix espanaensis (strain ATCC 51144 / DSM 44229 / JCM 9112 / NBRC 15066 / NRRL 15764) TaxID=1179773 RepID=K0JZ65_SACES|nr:ABC transporter ATP-binding protein [Saccharothrix espanaensis]CCH31421.1 ABC transporter-like protein [Saccharothrix espanaensis DSM 44229]
MTGEPDPREGALVTPHWQLDDADRAPRRTLRGLPSATWPVLAMIRRAAPGPALAVVVMQVVSGLAAAFGLFATTGVLTELLASGAAGDRIVAALPQLVLVGAAFGLRGAMDVGVALAHARITPAVRRLAEERLYSASLGADLASFDDSRFYDRMHRARDRGLFFLERAADNLVELIGSLLGIAAAAGSLVVLHPALLPVLLLAVIPDGWAVQRAARLAYASVGRTVALDRRVQMVSDLATEREPAAEIRAYRAEPFVLHEYRVAADPLRDEEVRLATAQARVRGIGRALAGVGLAVTYVVLGLLVRYGWVPLAVAGTAVIAIRVATTALNRLVLAANQLVEQGMYVADYQDFLAAVPDSSAPDSAAPDPSAPDSAAGKPPGAGPPPLDPGRVVLDHVTFSYPESARTAVRDVTLTIEPGETVALVGENGSGKTTLAKLIAGLYPPTSGRVRWGGRDLADVDRRQAADRVMMVLQDPIRWPHTARVNVRVGRHERPDPAGAAVRSAAGQSGADEVVAGLPDEWETLLSKQFRGGVELSGGQWQRLAVARGLYRDAPLLIWDEPTAPLDAKAEFAVYESLRALAADRTVVLITHRLASVRHADRILLLHEGELVEQGTHAALLAAGGRYAELYELQSRMYADA